MLGFLRFSSRNPFALTRDFGRDVALLSAYNQRRLGLRAVPIAAITRWLSRLLEAGADLTRRLSKRALDLMLTE